MKSDARVRYTKMVIKNSFVKLLAKKPLTRVIVKEICELSEINRATFYKYYCDPYDLLEKLENDKRFQQLKPSEQKFFFYFVAQGCSGILSQWLENGMTEPVSEVAGFADKLVQSTLKSM